MNLEAACRSGRFFLYLIWHTSTTPQTQIKQMALTVVTMPKACPGTSLLSSAPAEITSVEMNSELAGTKFLFSLPNRAEA
ncbi:hypothetical protein D3C81_2241510 [compost metagenome]